MRPRLNDHIGAVILDVIDHGLLADSHLRTAEVGQHFAIGERCAPAEWLAGAG